MIETRPARKFYGMIVSVTVFVMFNVVLLGETVIEHIAQPSDAGWLTKHLFFWTTESRSMPSRPTLCTLT